MHQIKRILCLGNDIGGDIGRVGASGLRVQIPHPTYGVLASWILNQRNSAGKATAETGDGGRRNPGAPGKFNDRGIDGEIESLSRISQMRFSACEN